MSSRNIAFAAAGVGGGTATYIEDVFSTYLYTANGASQTITNGIDLAGNGGMVWTKSRSLAYTNLLYDTVRGVNNYLASNNTSSALTASSTLTNFNSNGFTLGVNDDSNYTAGSTSVSWTFRKQPKFFDVVTYTGNGSLQNINHSLGTTPGMIIIKSTSSTSYWTVYHRSTGATQFLTLNNTFQAFTDTSVWNDTEPTSTQFTVGSYGYVNGNGQTYVAYLFAHNAGGFGESGTDNIISCGSYTGTGTANTNINLGFEPQFILTKRADSSGNWFMQDIMRQMSLKNTNYLLAQTADAETQYTYNGICPNPTGFTLDIYNNWNASGATYIYMAIRRPMKVPTDATTVFNPIVGDSTYPPAYHSSNFNAGIDSAIQFYTPGYSTYPNWQSRLTGTDQLSTPLTSAATTISFNKWDYMNGYNSYPGLNSIYGIWGFVRRPGFFDVVALNSSQNTYNNSLGTAPNMILVKCTNASGANWVVYHDGLSDPTNHYLRLNTTDAISGFSNAWAVSSTTFTVQSGLWANGTAGIAYLFSTCPGVSKVGSYIGTGGTQTINCGFTGGARFVLIKRTDSTGDWYVWDTTRGMVAETDPSFSLNSTGAQVNANSVYTATTGFQLLASPSADVNTSGGSYIFLAIA